MLADDILALLKRRPMTSEELAKELGKLQSLVETVLRKELTGLVEMQTDAKWKRLPPESVK